MGQNNYGLRVVYKDGREKTLWFPDDEKRLEEENHLFKTEMNETVYSMHTIDKK